MFTDKSAAIKAGIRRGFIDGSSKLARRRCYGYDNDADGRLVVNPAEAEVVRLIFGCYLAGASLGRIAERLAEMGIASPSGNERWSREAIHKLLSNEKYTGNVVLQKTISLGGAVQIKNNGNEDQHLYQGHHPAIITRDMFIAVQRAKQKRSKCPRQVVSPAMIF